MVSASTRYLSSFRVGGRNCPQVVSPELEVEAGFQMSAMGVLKGLNVLLPPICQSHTQKRAAEVGPPLQAILLHK